MNPNIEKLHPYPFEKLTLLKRGISPPAHLNPISLSIGEPTHKAPEFVKQTFSDSLVELNRYPTTRGTLELRDTIGQWLEKRFSLNTQSLDVDRNILPVCGTREAIFAFIQSTIAEENASEVPLLVIVTSPALAKSTVRLTPAEIVPSLVKLAMAADAAISAVLAVTEM